MAKYEVTIGGKTWRCDTLAEARALEKKHSKVKNPENPKYFSTGVPWSPQHHAACEEKFRQAAFDASLRVQDFLQQIRRDAEQRVARQTTGYTDSELRDIADQADQSRQQAEDNTLIDPVVRAVRWHEDLRAARARPRLPATLSAAVRLIRARTAAANANAEATIANAEANANYNNKTAARNKAAARALDAANNERDAAQAAYDKLHPQTKAVQRTVAAGREDVTYLRDALSAAALQYGNAMTLHHAEVALGLARRLQRALPSESHQFTVENWESVVRRLGGTAALPPARTTAAVQAARTPAQQQEDAAFLAAAFPKDAENKKKFPHRPKGGDAGYAKQYFDKYLFTINAPRCLVPIEFFTNSYGYEYAGFSPDGTQYFGKGKFTDDKNGNGCTRVHMPGLANVSDDRGTGVGPALYTAGPLFVPVTSGVEQNCIYSPAFGCPDYDRTPAATKAWKNLVKEGTADEVEVGGTVTTTVDITDYFNAGEGEFEDWTRIDRIDPEEVEVTGESDETGCTQQEIQLRTVLHLGIILHASDELLTAWRKDEDSWQDPELCPPAEVFAEFDFEKTPAVKLRKYIRFCAENSAPNDMSEHFPTKSDRAAARQENETFAQDYESKAEMAIERNVSAPDLYGQLRLKLNPRRNGGQLKRNPAADK